MKSARRKQAQNTTPSTGKGKATEDIGVVCDLHHDSESMCVICGTTGQRVLMGQDGWTMSSIAKWLGQEKSYAITGVGLLLSISLVALLLGFVAGMKWDQIKSEVLNFGSKRYMLVGLAKPNGMEDDLYMPIYKEAK